MKKEEARRTAMCMRNTKTGDEIQIPPPDEFGRGPIIFNGQVVESCEYSDSDGGWIKLESGRQFSAGGDFANWVVEKLANGGWKV